MCMYCVNNAHSDSKSALLANRRWSLFVRDIDYNFHQLQQKADMNALWISVEYDRGSAKWKSRNVWGCLRIPFDLMKLDTDPDSTERFGQTFFHFQ